MNSQTKVYLLDDRGQRFFGDGPCQLFRLVEQTGSLRAAAIRMGMAYTKAMKLLRQAESAMGQPLLHRNTGGKDGGGSSLTEQGKELVERYERYKEQCLQTNRELYLQIFESP